MFARRDGQHVRSRETLVIRGQTQTLHTYGPRGGTPVIVSSGDGGWIHLGPHVAEVLAAHGFFVVGFDVKGYLAGFTSASRTASPGGRAGRLPRARSTSRRSGVSVRPMLVGVSEGAGLSVLAAADPRVQAAAARASSASGCRRSTSSGGAGAIR